MKIKAKLLIGFLTLLLIALSLTLIGYDRLNRMNNQMQGIYQDRYQKILASSGMRGEVNGMARILTNIMLNPDSNLSTQSNEIEQSLVRADQYAAQMKALKQTVEEEQMFTRIEKAVSAYYAYQERVLSLLEEGNLATANAFRQQTGISVQNEVLSSLNDLAEFENLKINEEINTAKDAFQQSIQIVTAVMVTGLLLGLGIILWVLPSISKGLNTVSRMVASLGSGRLGDLQSVRYPSNDEFGSVVRAFQNMAGDLEEKQELEAAYIKEQQDHAWLNANVARTTELLRGVNSLGAVSQTFISEFTPVIGAQFGAVYLREKTNPNRFEIKGAYAFDESKPKNGFELGSGLVGQCALDKKPILLQETPDTYFNVASGYGSGRPGFIALYPLLFEDEVLGVIEFASFKPYPELHYELMEQLALNMAAIVNNITHRLAVEELLRESQALTEELQCQSEELQTQQEELRRSNENLEEQTDALKRSEELLQRQQEELEHYNSELLDKTRSLEEQVQLVEEKKDEIEEARRQLEKQAAQLAATSKYKSEFMANMSHELRTPLNSLLILSQLLSENKNGNLTDKQVEFAQTIYTSGADLLKMIDEILDLSKVDAGRMVLNREKVALTDLKSFVKHNFAPQAQKKGIALRLSFLEPLPDVIATDGYRLKQVLRNLLSNAFKFTSKGYVEFSVSMAEEQQLPAYLPLDREYLAIAVSDSGIGIPEDKQDLVFEAFQQADGTTSRKYGGTGLGLSISRELSRLMGGGIVLESEQGAGSVFTLFLPVSADYSQPGANASGEAAAAAEGTEEAAAGGEHSGALPAPEAEAPFDDDRDNLEPSDKVLLIIEDDRKFAGILLDMARSRGFKTLVALRGDTGLSMAKSYLPDAIILDIQLPVMDGWAILRELKEKANTRHIPVHVISINDEVKQGLMMGAFAYLRKPSGKEALERAFTRIEAYTENTLKHLLIVEDDDIQRRSIVELIGYDDVAITAVSTGGEALNELRKRKYDCMVLDLMLGDMDGFELLDHIRDDEEMGDLPIIIYTGKDLDIKEETRLRKYAESIIIKDVRSPERLLDETTLFLHRVEANLPEDKRKILRKLHNKEELFEGKKILLVDDDIRNVFALSSMLEGYQMEVSFAENGREALETLKEHPDIDLVLMDMMMPEMDGYEAMQKIREMPQFAKLPVIALTAKAMKEDRFKCIEAGASDYMKKPIDTDQLLSLMRVWLYS